MPSIKGLSPLITVVILIVITLTVAAILAYWAQQYIFVKTKNATEADKIITNCLKIDFSISGKMSNDEPIIIVENSGSIEINGLGDIVMESKHGDVLVINSSFTSPSLNTTIKTGGIVVFKILPPLADMIPGDEWTITAKPLECPGIKRFGKLVG